MKIAHSMVLLFCIILLTIPVNALSRQDSIVDFVDETRISSSGFANSPNGDLRLKPTVQAMEIKYLLGDELNDSLDILYYFQRLQNESGGFASDESSMPSLQATVDAIHGFRFLEINQSQYAEWTIYPFLNNTIQSRLITTINGTANLKPLTVDNLRLWHNYIISSTQLGEIPTVPTLSLIDQIKSLQYQNGSYPSFSIAVSAVNLLSLIGEEPKDPDLAKKFILSFATENKAFSTEYDGEPTLVATYHGVQALSKLVEVSSMEMVTDLIRFVFNRQQARSGFAEAGSSIPTVADTYYSILILALLNSLDELQAPDVLQEVGFVNFPIFGLIMIIIFPILRRYSK